MRTDVLRTGFITCGAWCAAVWSYYAVSAIDQATDGARRRLHRAAGEPGPVELSPLNLQARSRFAALLEGATLMTGYH